MKNTQILIILLEKQNTKRTLLLNLKKSDLITQFTLDSHGHLEWDEISQDIQSAFQDGFMNYHEQDLETYGVYKDADKSSEAMLEEFEDNVLDLGEEHYEEFMEWLGK